METIVMEENPRRRINVREWILRLAVFHQNSRRYLRVPPYELEYRIFGNLGPGGGEFHEGFETWVWFSEDGVAVAGDDLPGFEGRPEIVLDVLVGEGGADVGLHFQDPAEDFLGGEAGEVYVSLLHEHG